MNKFTRKIASIITAAAMAFSAVALPDTGILPGLAVTASATSPWWVTSGEGTASSPYLISNSQHWSTFARYINTENSTYGDKYYKLTADITVDTNDTSAIFVGGSTEPFRGHFDGGGHTLTFNYSGQANGAAPFRYVSGATIENLNVAGNINSILGATKDAGIAGNVTGNTTITNCKSSVTINGSSSQSGLFGGLVGSVASGVTLNISNCVFNGSITGSAEYQCGGFVGYNSGTVNITDCLLDPGSIGVGMYSFVQDRSNGISSLTRAYRTYDFSGIFDQGIRVYTDAPANAFSKKVKIFTNDYYWQPGTAAITGVESSYPLTGDSIALPACGVSLDGEALSSSDYTVTVTNSSSQTVSSITDAGTYTLTVTGKGNYSGSASKTFKVYGINSIPYIDATGDEKEAGSATRLESATLPECDWWYVTGETTIDSRISISGTNHLILTDGAVLNITKGIQLASGNTLNIYGQSGNTGKLVITGVEYGNAGIGGNSHQSCGTLTVNGGDITVTGGSDAAGIGGGISGTAGNAHGGTVTINGGKVTAKGGSDQTVGIGGGGTASSGSNHIGGNGGTIVINGGIVSATGNGKGSGMGGGLNCVDKGTVTINWKNVSDSIYASSYNSNITVVGDFVHNGTNTKATSDNIGGKTLVPAKKITVGSVTNGTIALPNNAASGSYFGIGSTVTLNVTPDISYAIESVKYGTTEIVPVSGVYSFVMPANDATVSATFVYDPSHISVNDEGTEYTIHDSTGWNQFCGLVNGGNAFEGKTVKLDNSISVSTTVGTSSSKFKGIFDGDGNTLYITLSSDADNCAPFLYIEGATIQNLNIAGNITTSKKFAASLAAHTYGTTNITNCHSTVTITSSATSSGDGTHGGFVAVNEGSATLNFTGCSFKGSMLGSNANSNGGFVGYNNGTKINYTDCLFAPSEISMSGSNSCTFNRNSKNFFTNTYYTTVLGTAEGKRAYTITAADENISVALAEGSTAGVSFGDTIYGAENDIVSLTLSHTTPAGKTFSSYTASAGTLTGTENPYTLTMPAGNVTVSAEFEGGSLETVATPTFTPAAGSYIGTQSVEISCETDGATIYYTTNGSTPTTSSTAYSEAISVSTTTTIKAIAVKSGMTDSAVASAEYTITPATYTLTVTAPTFDAVTAGYAQPDAQAITITSTGNSNATISSVALSGTNAGSFTLTNGTASVTAGGTNSSYTIRPNAGLAVGTYTATITVTYDGNETATADVSFTVNEATPTTYTVTYKVVNGTWADDTTADKTETVTSGAHPSDVPTGMKASSGYTGGAWDTNPSTATITEATTFTYTFTAVPTYAVTVNNGTGGGSYAQGASVTITAGAAPSGQQFKEWTGADGLTFTSGSATSSTATFTMPASAVEVTATYEDIPATTYTVTYKVVNGTWADDTTADKTETVTSGVNPSNVPTGMKASSGYTGGAWDTDPTTVTITGATTFTYTFTAVPTYAVTVNNGTGGGSYAAGASVTITAGAAPSGQQFKEWTGADGLTFTSGSATSSTATFTMPASAVTVTATYENIPATTYTVTYKVVNGTWADDTTADKTETVADGAHPSDVPTGMKASSGYTGGAWDTDPSTAAITEATTFTYTFTAVPTYAVTVNNGTGGGSYAQGASVTITANAAPSGQQFKEWTGADGLTFTSGSATTSTATFTMPANAVEVTATYEDIPATSYAVTITAGTNMTTSGAANQTVTAGSAITNVVYTANDGYYFPTTYSVAAVNGISVTRDSYTQITVSGTPTAAASITLTAATAKTKPATPTTPSVTDCTTAGNNDGTITGITADMEYKKSDAAGWTAGTGSVITGLSNGTYYVRIKATDTTIASDNQVLTIAAYTASGQVAAPTFNPAAGSYIGTKSVTISCATAGATIHYTTDGTDPIAESAVYTTPISVSTTTTIKAMAVKDEMDNSSVSTAIYTINPATYTLSVTAPTFDTVSVGYAQPAAKAITITSTGNSNATISSVELSGTNADSFTLTNGTASVTAGGTNTNYTIRPNAGLAAGTYTATITVTYNGEATATANVSFTVNALDVVATPTFSPVGGEYTEAQSVTISCATSDATIYYTTNGSTPTTSSTKYTGVISVSTTTTIKAIAVKSGMTNSSVASATYTITPAETVETPTFSPAGGTFTSAQSVTISCATSDATIYYTTDGTTPTTSSAIYSSAISVSATTTIKAIAVKAGMTNSAVASATYTISSVHVHSYTSAVTTEPTCTTTGLRTYTCSGCGDIYTEVIPLAAHKYTAVRENEVAPDCIHAGSYDEVEKCSVCGNVKSRTTKTVPALGHDFVNGKCTRCDAVEMTTGDLPSIIENNEEETVILALEADTNVPTLKFPKNVKEIIIDGCGHTLDFTSTASIKPYQKLTLVNITIKAEKNGKKQNITLTAAAGGLVLENVTFDGKKTTITATKGDLTLDNVTANNLTVKGAAKRTLTVEGNVNAATISGFGNIKADGSLNVTKTLKVNTLDLSENAVLNVVKGAAITLSKGISGNGTINLASGFKAITINGKATGNIKLTGDKMTDGQLIFKSKLTNLNGVFDVSGIAPTVTDGEYSYGLYAKSGKVYLRAFKMQVGDKTYCELSDVLNGINKSKEKGKSYELDLLGDIDFGKSFKLPTKGKYNSLSINGNGHSISFNGTTLTLTGNLTLKNVKITAMKNGKPVAWTIKKKKYELVTENVELENCKVE